MYKEALPRAGNPIKDVKRRVINRTDGAVAVGELLIFAFNIDAPTATGGEKGGGPGTPTGTGTITSPAPYSMADTIFANVDDPANPAQNTMQWYCVVTDLLDGAGADGTEIEVQTQGRVQCNAVSGNYDVGDPLMGHTTGANREVMAYAAADGNRCIGVCLTEADSVETIEIILFGSQGFLTTGNEA